jgi:hypothetical protein
MCALLSRAHNTVPITPVQGLERFEMPLAHVQSVFSLVQCLADYQVRTSRRPHVLASIDTEGTGLL